MRAMRKKCKKCGKKYCKQKYSTCPHCRTKRTGWEKKVEQMGSKKLERYLSRLCPKILDKEN